MAAIVSSLVLQQMETIRTLYTMAREQAGISAEEARADLEYHGYPHAIAAVEALGYTVSRRNLMGGGDHIDTSITVTDNRTGRYIIARSARHTTVENVR